MSFGSLTTTGAVQMNLGPRSVAMLLARPTLEFHGSGYAAHALAVYYDDGWKH